MARQPKSGMRVAEIIASTPAGEVSVHRPFVARDAAGGRDLQGLAAISRAALKRTLDIVVAAVFLLVLAPAMFLIAIAIVLESPGPLFYRADRVGRGGRPLRMLKFRKMHRDAAGARLTVAGDARLTRVGAILARTRLDELPQMWHVLRGDMSLVGPRPEDPEFVRACEAEFERILAVRPGVTGLSQLAYAGERAILAVDDPVPFYVERILPQKCRLDALYAQQRSLRMDVAIIAWTAVALVAGRSVAVDRRTGRLGLRRRREGRRA